MERLYLDSWIGDALAPFNATLVYAIVSSRAPRWSLAVSSDSTPT